MCVSKFVQGLKYAEAKNNKKLLQSLLQSKFDAAQVGILGLQDFLQTLVWLLNDGEKPLLIS